MKTESELCYSRFYLVPTCVLIFMFVLPGLFSFGQLNDSVSLKKKVVKYDFVSIAGDWVTNSSGIGLGFEFGISNGLSLEQDLTYLFEAEQGASNSSVNVEDLNGIKSNSELHFYFNKSTSTNLIGLYWGPNLVFQYTNAKHEEWLESNTIHYYTVHRYFTALNLKLGYQGEIYRNLLIDVAVGAGIQNISSNSNDKISEGKGLSEFPFGKYYDSGSDWIIGPSFNLRIGFRF